MKGLSRYILPGLVALIGCYSAGDGRRQSPPAAAFAVIEGSTTPPGLSLHLWLAKDTLTAYDSLGVMYLLRNSGEPRSINMQPDHFQFVVEDPGGKQLPGGRFDRDQKFGDVHATRVGTGGVSGQTVWLSCTSCAYGLAFDLPGRYTIRVKYSPPPAPGSHGEGPEPGQVVLVSQPVTFWLRR